MSGPLRVGIFFDSHCRLYGRQKSSVNWTEL